MCLQVEIKENKEKNKQKTIRPLFILCFICWKKFVCFDFRMNDKIYGMLDANCVIYTGPKMHILQQLP